MSNREDQTTILITGCSSGIGKALARHLGSKSGVTVIATARRLAALEDLQDCCHCLQLDVQDQESIAMCIRKIRQDVGDRIDILINNAGFSRIGALAEQPLGEIQDVFDVNVFGVLRVVQAVFPWMANQGGLILNVGSVTSFITTPWSGAYSASKAALLNLTNALRMECAPFNIDVAYIMAGAVRSQLAANTLAACQFSGYKLFSPWVSSMEKRAMLSQGSNAMSAEHVCKDVSKVIDRWKKTLTLMMSASMVDHLLMNQYDLSHDTKKP